MASSSVDQGRRHLFQRLFLAAALALLGGLANFGVISPGLDDRRMNALAAAALADIRPGMTVSEAAHALGRHGLTHSDLHPASDVMDAGPADHAVLLAMIRHRASRLGLVQRDVQLRIFVDEQSRVIRAERRDVMSGP